MKPRFTISADGGARGNPGPAALGYVIRDSEGKLVKALGEAIGETTNNVAEYRAAVAALKKLKALIGTIRARETEVEVRMDSELVTRHMNRQYKIRDAKLVPLFIELWNATQDYGAVRFHHVPRSDNREADQLVNEALDRPQGNIAI
ncbi:MAG: hypothetical protein A2682_03815 [Candidatus Terrybacteria bacterium RIFCSPHIGHO2_01_FULL_58_15]|uniref:RNase H type-1 domain-containing protein n=1 Tax=Terrybacteria sp. (strain RIFCSPHIGHO2_01_FULL_58_15) TaxID=1802363 RepID=A0A1G2PLC1_TERXR|nr:MAG: hypothetical protein A2682_03815 [Candidatus Terrybacteria bacterium RIFCSPHIGHO2_01_FULL_58_15]